MLQPFAFDRAHYVKGQLRQKSPCAKPAPRLGKHYVKTPSFLSGFGHPPAIPLFHSPCGRRLGADELFHTTTTPGLSQ
jgi:hypothetical protein